MRILVAGGAGFIGSHLVERYLGLDAQNAVLVLDDFSTGKVSNLRGIEKRLANCQLDWFELDVGGSWDPEAERAFADATAFQPDVVYHLASPCSPPLYQADPLQALRANSIGTDRLLALALKSESRFLYASTSEVYGDPLEHPQSERYRGNVDPTGLRSMYDEAKRFGEAMTTAYKRKYGVETRIARIFNTFGPRMPDDGRVVMSLIRAALAGKPLPIHGNGLQTRSFLYVDDLVEGLIRLTNCSAVDRHLPINLGSTEEVSIRRLAGLVSAAVTGTSARIDEGPPDADDPSRRRPSILRAQRLLDWVPTVVLAEGLRRTVDWCRSGSSG